MPIPCLVAWPDLSAANRRLIPFTRFRSAGRHNQATLCPSPRLYVSVKYERRITRREGYRGSISIRAIDQSATVPAPPSLPSSRLLPPPPSSLTPSSFWSVNILHVGVPLYLTSALKTTRPGGDQFSLKDEIKPLGFHLSGSLRLRRAHKNKTEARTHSSNWP